MIRPLFVRLVLFGVVLCTAPVACAQEPRTPAEAAAMAREAVRTGDYDKAAALAQSWAAREAASAEFVRVQATALAATGRYAEAEQAITRFNAANPRDASLWNLLGEVQRDRGRLAEAEASFRRAVGGRAADSLLARLNLAVLRFDRGEVDEAMQDFDAFIDIYNSRRRSLTASELTAVAIACRYLGRNDPQLFKDAMRAFDEAISADSSDLDRRVLLAELFLEKYNSADALSTLAPVLEANPRHARGLLAMARLRYFDDQSDVEQYLRRSLEVNPHSPDARAFSAQLLLDLERYADAATEARLGLAADSTAPAALISLAAAQYLQHDTAAFRATLAKIHGRRPRSADAEAVLSNIAARNRLYAQAVEFAEAGVQRDPKAARALAYLGINALRVGDIQRGRQMLEQAFALDPYDVWAKNTLDLLDTLKDYDEVGTPRFRLVIEKKDAPLLSMYAGPLAEEAYDSLSARYGFRPKTPVRIEFYRSHTDFSVRTVGLTGLGALGVSFGQVVAMDSPAARSIGEFNWGSTLWHELAHVFTLGASGNRVPRWFSEGLSVYEERRARPSWGDDASPLFFAAYAAGRLPKVSRLNDGFMRPTFPEQVILSYYLASLVCEMIEREHGGMATIRAMLQGYRDGRTTEQVMREVLKSEPAAFDAKFDAWMRQRYGRQLASVTADAALGAVGGARRPSGRGGAIGGEYVETLERGRTLLNEGKIDDAIVELEKAKAMFPDFADGESPYALLARAYEQQGQQAKAAQELAALTAINEHAYHENLSLAALALEGLSDVRVAVTALDRAVWIHPFDPTVHEKLAQAAARAGNRPLAVRERRAIVALDPTDRVEALYQLALALTEAGQVDAARREVLRALELAPNFEQGQELLLRLRAMRPPGGLP